VLNFYRLIVKQINLLDKVNLLKMLKKVIRLRFKSHIIRQLKINLKMLMTVPHYNYYF